ncbi:hypothetical protein QYE76_069071 [Lolium multiflorum]|uniref:Retrotransposon gag domain-containing protein n=1 Tax=Lolium multiflorum TaxID=4521 RepID=A0AAD8SH14_LOLMU|nr:hypothetical protein QYE76_069071 [Lolium multiflorum]
MPPKKFKPTPTDAAKYDGQQEPRSWIDDYLQTVILQREPDSSNAVQLYLKDSARAWLRGLPKGSIKSWDDLVDAFVANFQATYKRPVGIEELRNCQQKQKESMRSYIGRFTKLLNAAEDVSVDRAIDAFSDGVRRKYRSGGTPLQPASARDQEALRAVARGAGPAAALVIPALRCWPSLPAGGFLTSTHSGTPGGTIFNDNHLAIHIRDGESTPVEYEDRNGKVRALREADLIGSSHDARSHGTKQRGSHARGKEKDEAVPRDRPQDDNKRYLAEEEVGNIWHPRPSPEHLLSKYEQPYDRHRRYDDDDEGYRRFGANRRYRQNSGHDDGSERRARGRSEEPDNVDRHWDCPFFRHCWDSGMSRLPTIGNCPECKRKEKGAAKVSVFERLGPLPPRSKHAEPVQMEDREELEDDDEEDKYHRPRWCPDGLSRSQKRRVQRLRALEEAERLYLHALRKARPDLAAKIQRALDEEGRPQRKEWRPKQRKADDETSAGTNMVFILPAEFSAPRLHEAPWHNWIAAHGRSSSRSRGKGVTGI